MVAGEFTMVAGALTVAVEAISVETGQGRIVGAIEGGKSVDVIGVSMWVRLVLYAIWTH